MRTNIIVFLSFATLCYVGAFIPQINRAKSSSTSLFQKLEQQAIDIYYQETPNTSKKGQYDAELLKSFKLLTDVLKGMST